MENFENKKKQKTIGCENEKTNAASYESFLQIGNAEAILLSPR